MRGSRPGRALAASTILVATLAGCAPAAAVAQEPMEVVVTEVWSTPGDPGFGLPTGMAQWPDGTVWVGDRSLEEVYEVSADGQRVAVALRSGDGPREVGSVHRIVALPTSGMVVWEGSRLAFFGADKRPDRRFPEQGSIWIMGFIATPDGGFVASGGFGSDPSHQLARWSVHRYDGRARHVKSWHPAADRRSWEIVRSASGGPVAVTRDGGLLVSDAAPFRITRYADLEGGGARLLVEDEGVVSSSELDRAVAFGPNNSRTYTSRWTKSSFVHELADGAVLNVVEVVPADDALPQSGLWLVVSPDGEIVARTPTARRYRVWNATPDGHFLATYWDEPNLRSVAVKLAVELAPKS